MFLSILKGPVTYLIKKEKFHLKQTSLENINTHQINT